MKRNEGTFDRAVRLALGVTLAVLAFVVGALWLKIALGVLAGIALFTAATGFCLLYLPVGIDTARAAKPPEERPRGCCS